MDSQGPLGFDGGTGSSSEQRLIAAVRERGPLSRQDLAAATGLSMATINRAGAGLLKRRLLVTKGRKDSTGGRPAELLAYNGGALTVAGISVTETKASGVIMGLDGHEVSRSEVEFQPSTAGAEPTPEDRLDQTLRLFDEMVSAGHGALAVGVAVPGVVAGPDGTIGAIHEMGWDRLRLGSILAGRSPAKVVLENDANCLAVGEKARGAGRQVEDLVAIVLRSGLGAGLMLQGRLYRGHRQEAGEIGYLLTSTDSLSRLFPGRGDFESRIGSESVGRQAAALGLVQAGREVSLPTVWALGARAGGRGQRLAQELLDYIALGVAALCVALDPEMVIMGGCDDLESMEAIIPALRERLLGRILRVPRIVTAALGSDAIMIGAAQLAMEELVTI
ncbi:MAG: ROK family protein [Micrococcales bacterium]|nr:ROK family protein [Micrococcales bacterium]